MAKPDKKANESDEQKKGSFFKDERVKFTFGVFVVFFAIFLALSQISYIFTWRTDQSAEWISIFSGTSIRVENWGGKVGALFASGLMNHSFGISSLVIPFLVVLLGLKQLNIKPFQIRRTFFKSILGIVLVSLVLGFLFGDFGGFLGSGLGGLHGLFISQWMSAFVGKLGTALLLFIFSVAFIIYIRPNSVYSMQRIAKQIACAIGSLFSPKAKSDDIEKIEFDSFEKEPDEPVQEVEPSIEFVNNDKGTIMNIVDPLMLNGEEEKEFDSEAEMELPSEAENEAEVADKGIIKNHVIPDEVELTVEFNREQEGVAAKTNLDEEYDPTLDLSMYQRPPLELLEDYKNRQAPVSDEELQSNKKRIVETLANYKIEIARIVATVGPTVTLYEIVPAPGVRISKIKSLEDDIALSLSALGIRIIAPIPGKGTIGIEVPNQNPEVVSMYSILRSAKFQESRFDLAIALGKTISNETFVIDLAKMPHLLVAGATGQGKSVGLNAIIASLLYKKHPSQLKFVLVDPKKVELTLYAKLEKHFLAKLPDTEEAIITDTQKVINTLNSLCIEMDSRYDLLKAAHVRNLKEYNEKFIARRLNPNKGHKFLPYIIVIIDEFADLIMTAGREIETPIARLAQLARAIGIHLIIATQRPTTNIITGVIKANFPARIAFRVSSMIDSRTILDTPGANQLIGRGDMLVATGNDLVRVQCAFVDTPEIERLTDFVGNQQGYSTAFMLPEYTGDTADEQQYVDLQKRDDMFEDAALLVVQYQQGSTSLIQRKFSIGYNRAGRIMDQLEAAGIVGPSEGSKARQVLITDEDSLQKVFDSLNQM